jgi:hypothetical protein
MASSVIHELRGAGLPEATQRRRVLLIGHRYHLERSQRGFYLALARRFDLVIHMVEDGWPAAIDDIPDYQTYDACIWFVRFRELMQAPQFQWKNYQGIRLMYDLDAHQNFHLLLDGKYLGKWPEVFHRNEFQVLVCTGRATRDALIGDGVPSIWLPKGYDPSQLFDMGLPRKGICYFGTLYSSRKAMTHFLRRKGLSFDIFCCNPDQLNEYLNKYLGCLICNMAGVVQPGIRKILHRMFPSYGIALTPGVEPMLKNFEVAGAGCAPLADFIEELGELGFIDGDTMVSYRSFEELAEKMHHYAKYPDELRDIGKRARQLALARHTWDHRAQELGRSLESYF